MNNIEERIIRYLDGDLSPEEKHKFEQDLETSDQLRTQLETYRNTFSLIADARKIQIPDTYIQKSPEFTNVRRTFNFPVKYAYAIFVIAMITGLLYFLDNSSGSKMLNYEETLIQEIDGEQIRTYFETSASSEEYYTDIQVSSINGNGYIDSLILSELNISQQNFDELIDAYFSDLNASVFNDDDLEEIYAELSNKHFY